MKKLTIKKLTLRHLSAQETRVAVGGAPDDGDTDLCTLLCTLGRFCKFPTDLGCPSGACRP
jgi:hypothetical protein